MTRHPATNFAIASTALFAVVFTTATRLGAQEVPLNTAAAFAVLAGTTITNTGTTVINGDVGVSPGTAVTGFPPGIIVAPGAMHLNDAVAVQAEIDLVTAYNNLAGRSATADLTGQDLGGLVLKAGVYNFNSSAQLTGTLILDAKGNPNAIFIINIASTLTTASNSRVVLVNGAQGSRVFFRVGSSAVLGTATFFAGDIIALTSITLDTAASINCGAALARNGAVTLDTNTISVCVAAAGTPGTPGTIVVPIGSVLPSSAPGNDRSVASGLDRFVANGGTLPPGFEGLLIFSTPDELAAAFTQLSGEAGTGAAPAGIRAMSSFLSLLINPFDEERSGPPEVPASRPMYTKGPYYKAPVGIDPYVRRWDIWAAVYGGTNSTGGDPFGTGSHDRMTRTYGLATGFDYRLTPDTRVGFALAGGTTNFGISDNLGGGRSDMLQTAIYGRTYFNAAYVAAALAYAWADVSTDRFVTLAGTDHLTAAFHAYDVAGRIEGGYRFDVPNVFGLLGYGWGFTPYAALQAQAFFTPSYSESAASGSSTFALNYDARTTTTVRTELGDWISRNLEFDNGTILALRSRTAWAHDHWSSPSIAAMFQALPGSNFTVFGATPARDSLLLTSGAEIRFRNGFALAGWFDSEYAQHSQTYSGTARLRYAW